MQVLGRLFWKEYCREVVLIIVRINDGLHDKFYLWTKSDHVPIFGEEIWCDFLLKSLLEKTLNMALTMVRKYEVILYQLICIKKIVCSRSSQKNPISNNLVPTPLRRGPYFRQINRLESLIVPKIVNNLRHTSDS